MSAQQIPNTTTPSTTVIQQPETDRAAASLLLTVAQTMQIEANHQKELLRRDLTRRDKTEAERDEQRQALAPSRKRDREYYDAQDAILHQDRMQKLTEEQDNDRRTRQCSIERKTLRHARDLAYNLRNTQLQNELSNIELERRAFHKELDAEETSVANARRIATLQREAAEALEDERFRQREQAGDFQFNLRRRAAKRQFAVANGENNMQARTTDIALFEKHGFSIPAKFF
jgi:hypothetical protein